MPNRESSFTNRSLQFQKIRKAYRKYDIEAWRRALKIGKPAFNRLREALRQDPEKL